MATAKRYWGPGTAGCQENESVNSFVPADQAIAGLCKAQSFTFRTWAGRRIIFVSLAFLRESVKWIDWQARKARDDTMITYVVAGKNYSGR